MKLTLDEAKLINRLLLQESYTIKRDIRKEWNYPDIEKDYHTVMKLIEKLTKEIHDKQHK